jgi:hypothetical protein
MAGKQRYVERKGCSVLTAHELGERYSKERPALTLPRKSSSTRHLYSLVGSILPTTVPCSLRSKHRAYDTLRVSCCA